MRWSLQAKFNKVLGEIHKPVAQFTKHFALKAHSILKSLKPEAPIWRANWSVFNDLKSPLDLYSPAGHSELNETNTTTVYQGDRTGRDLIFRVEYQTLRKLPKTQCIVFSIRSYQRYLEDFKQFPANDAEGLIKAIENLDQDEKGYKGAAFWAEAAIKYLRNDVLKEKIEDKTRILKPAKIASMIVAASAIIFIFIKSYLD